MSDEILREQIAYYRARAGEYDDWFYRRGRYDHGPEATRRWFAEVEAVRAALGEFAPGGEVLELAAGTGIWTAELLRLVDHVTAIDASPETLDRNRARNGEERVRFLEADVLAWKPDRAYDTVFFGFWLSHVPPERFAGFWERVRACLRPGGRVFFVDSLLDPASTARDHVPPDLERFRSRRKLDDGREFTVVKVYYDPRDLAARLRGLGWEIEVRTTGRFFLHGSGRIAGGSPTGS